MAELSPMMKQYFEIKEQHPNSLLFFRLGDFYEMFFDDAKIASQELELVLTGRDCGQEERAPMCGVPYHSCESYIARLVARGYKVAICEQLEDPSTTKGLVKRDVIRVITPGTVIEGTMLDESRNNYLCAICMNDKYTEVGVCFADCSTGDLQATQIMGEDIVERLCNELARFSPSEILINTAAAAQKTLMTFIEQRLNRQAEVRDVAAFDYEAASGRVCDHFAKKSLHYLDLQDSALLVRSLGALLEYLQVTQMNGLQRIQELHTYSDAQFMRLDIATRRNLELIETMRSKDKKGSLLGVLDRTRTAMGKRLIRSWIEQPLIQPAPIVRRQNAVAELVREHVMRQELQQILVDVYDIERIMTRVVYGSANAKELRTLAQTIGCIAPIREWLAPTKSQFLQSIFEHMDPLSDVKEWIDHAIVDDPPLQIRDGGMIREGYHAEADELRHIIEDGTDIIAQVEAQEKEKTGIKTLKVRYNKVFGYYIEVSQSFVDQVPEHYIRKQTLTNAERYITSELKELESRILGAKDRLIALEYQLFTELRDRIAAELPRIQQTAQALAQTDVLVSLADVAVRQQYVCPVIDMQKAVRIVGGRHPVIEHLSDAPFVANDTLLDGDDNRVAVITGPNMAGKSTYMRQTALIVLMAQIGSFVPAESATVGIVDSIFTRVGASDDLSMGQSTFMVEMNEVAHILTNATENSLIVFDEIGRGTSTFDGMSIAKAVLEFVAKQIKAKTLFATHYHELTDMEHTMTGIRNYNVAVKKRGDDITFLRRIVRGPADDSYGIEVAKLAGVPDPVIKRAKEILAQIIDGELVMHAPAVREDRFEEDNGQLSLLPTEQNELVARIKQIDVNTLTPIEALQTLYELVRSVSE